MDALVCALLVEKAPELLHTISILPILKEVHIPVVLATWVICSQNRHLQNEF